MASRAVEQVPARLFPLLLYKRILRVHYGLPAPARLMGDVYVKDEFRRHKGAESAHAQVFLKEWTDYFMVLSKQLSHKGIAKGALGRDLSTLDGFSDEQLRQLLELKVETETAKGNKVEL